MDEVTGKMELPRAGLVVLGLFVVISGVLLTRPPGIYPSLHTVLDTSTALLSGVIAVLLWDRGRHAEACLPKWLAISFALAFLLEFIHFMVVIEWSGPFAAIAAAQGDLRPLTWPGSVHVLPIGIGLALWRSQRGSRDIAGFTLIMLAVAAGLFVAFQRLPAYSAGPLGMSRPALIAAPLLWAAVMAAAWRLRRKDRLIGALFWLGAPLFLGNIVMLYSQVPADAAAMVPHLGKIAGRLIFLISVMQMASRDMRDRIIAEARLTQLNAELDHRVSERTEQLASANAALEKEMTASRRSERKAQAQVERLYLLHQITRAIGERQDLNSIYQVVVRAVETQLPADFCCLCLYDDLDRVLTVGSVGANSEELALELAMPRRARIDIDENGLSRCVRGELVYEPDIASVDFPFPKRLAGGGLRSLVIAPLQVESRVFGVLAVARFKENSFVSGECEFLRQLSEHAALAAHQLQLYAALQQAYDDLRQSQQAAMQQDRLRALGQMASGIAHDINNALSPVALYTEAMLEGETGLSAGARNSLEIIRRAVEDVAHTISRMREFYRQRDPQPVQTAIDLNELVGQVVDLTRARWSDMAMQRGAVIKVETDLQAPLPAALGVESEIREALINLVMNAVDAMPDGGLLTLRTRSAGANGATRTVEIEVEDDGVGMDAETQQRCLEPFFTTKGERGTGLGLAMVYGVAQRHGAEMSITSTPGEGTKVSMSLPVQAEIGASLNGQPVAAGPINRLRVLLVDDDPVLLKALGDALHTDGHQVTLANDGQMGIDTFRTAMVDGNSFEAVITDLGMPYIDGRKVAAEIKALSPSTPVIMLTGWGQTLMADAEQPTHVDQLLSKPPKLREVREALANHGQAIQVRADAE
jgi:signal transduction histidine kinase/ActR/RegA family two-component response regulator